MTNETSTGNNCGSLRNNPADTVNGWTPITVSAPAGQPDLTFINGEGYISLDRSMYPSTFSVNKGDTPTLWASVRNKGTASTGGNYTTAFLLSTHPDGASPTVIVASNDQPSVPDNRQFGGGSYTFNTAGTFYVSACADYYGVIAESSEGNNCTGWTQVTVVAPAPTSCTLSPTSQTIAPGTPATLTTSSTGATTCTLSPNTPVSCNGTTTVSPSSSQSYGLTCASTGGTTNATPVTVSVGCSGTPAPSISASPNRVRPGNATTLTYSATGAQACTLSSTNPNFHPPALSPSACSLPQATVSSGALATQATYTITCDGVSKSVVVNVVPAVIEF